MYSKLGGIKLDISNNKIKSPNVGNVEVHF